MEPVTHVLTGVCLARAGLNRKAAYATLAMAVAAEFPDIDTLWGLRGPITGFEHHRGITHSFVGLPFEAGLLLLLVFLLHRWRERRYRSTQQPSGVPLTQAPVRWDLLYVFLLIALLSHLLLDYTNNYGIRPFLPFQAHWYAASIVFIFDPLIFFLLVFGLLLPGIFRLVASEVGAKRKPFHGVGWARAALVAVLLLWILRSDEHHKALVLANAQTLRAPAENPTTDQSPSQPSAVAPDADGALAAEPVRAILPAQNSLASPDPINIFRWYTATDFGPAYRLGTADTRTGTLAPGGILTKPLPGPLLHAAQLSHLGRVYLDWSPMPWLSVSTLGYPGTTIQGSTIRTSDDFVVTFQDPRFMGSSTLLSGSGKTPLSGQVMLDAQGNVLEQELGGRSGR